MCMCEYPYIHTSMYREDKEKATGSMLLNMHTYNTGNYVINTHCPHQPEEESEKNLDTPQNKTCDWPQAFPGFTKL